jgi:hypothetical protein
MISRQFATDRSLHAKAWGAVLLLAVLTLLSGSASADARDQAMRIHDRLVGVPPDEATLLAMETEIAVNGQAGAVAAAEIAMAHPAFYNVALKNFVAPWTNIEQTVYVDLNDYIATVIGMIRDDHPFNEVLTADLVYVGTDAGLPSYSVSDNDHYAAMEADRIDLSDPAELVPQTQSSLHPQLTPADAAGVVTTRAAAEAFFSAGTNRRMWRFTSKNYLCRDLEQLHDTSRPADRIRQDVNRSPGGDSTLFHTQCNGCHSGQDAVAGAYAYYEWDENASQMVYTPGLVQGKHLINDSTFPGGYVTVDDGWINFWRNGPNAALGWTGSQDRGNGAQSLGAEVAGSRAFSLCQVEKVFNNVCFRPPQTPTDASEIERIATLFEASGYRMKSVFAEVAAHCRGN